MSVNSQDVAFSLINTATIGAIGGCVNIEGSMASRTVKIRINDQESVEVDGDRLIHAVNAVSEIQNQNGPWRRWPHAMPEDH